MVITLGIEKDSDSNHSGRKLEIVKDRGSLPIEQEEDTGNK